MRILETFCKYMVRLLAAYFGSPLITLVVIFTPVTQMFLDKVNSYKSSSKKKASLKIVVPVPVDKSLQSRIAESLSLWEEKKLLLLCLPHSCNAPFLQEFETAIMKRNSTDIGSKQPRCYLQDMLQEMIDRYPEEDWYGICNSDCVPIGDLSENFENYEVIIHHRTDILDWEFRFNVGGRKTELPKDVLDQIYEMRRDGVSDKKIARKLNRAEIETPKGYEEWTYTMLQKLFFEQGIVYFWGQDMFLFHRSVMKKVMEYVKEVDFIVSVGGFDQKLTKWCEENLKSTRVINKIVHKSHTSEWHTDELEYQHNGDITDDEKMEYINETLLLGLGDNVDNCIPYIVENPLTFITTEKMIRATHVLASFLPSDIDVIVGIARSGLIPASDLSCHLHLPLFIVSDKEVINCGSGSRFKGKNIDPRKILVVDDTIFAGRTMKRILSIVRDAFPRSTILKAAVYTTPQAKHLVDYFACELAEPHYLEWNFFNAGLGERAIYDMDGILCYDIASENDDDSLRYIRALKNAIPKYLPRKSPIHMIVTARLKRYREVTLEWLERHKVKTDKLVMGPWDTLSERNRPNEITTFKSSVYHESGQKLFVESCPIQAAEICRQTGKRVLCPVAEKVFS